VFLAALPVLIYGIGAAIAVIGYAFIMTAFYAFVIKRFSLTFVGFMLASLTIAGAYAILGSIAGIAAIIIHFAKLCGGVA
jgi:hypothetical protein